MEKDEQFPTFVLTLVQNTGQVKKPEENSIQEVTIIQVNTTNGNTTFKPNLDWVNQSDSTQGDQHSK